jgi:hypothetical protein
MVKKVEVCLVFDVWRVASAVEDFLLIHGRSVVLQQILKILFTLQLHPSGRK